MITVEIKDDFKRGLGKILTESEYELNDNEFNLIVKAVREGVYAQYDNAVNPDGVGLKPNKKGTKLFYDTGELFSSITQRKLSKQHAQIFILSGRSQIAEWLQYGTHKMVSRPAFGIGKIIEGVIDQLITHILNKKVENLAK